MSKEAMKLALEALRKAMQGNLVFDEAMEAFKALEEALAKQEHGEPVFWWNGGTQFATQKSKDWDKRTGGTTAFGCDIPLYTTPQQRTWVGLTGEEIDSLSLTAATKSDISDIEAKLKAKNERLEKNT